MYAGERDQPAGRGGAACPAVIAAVAIPAVLFLPSIPFGAGAFGIGDVKLLAGVGLLVGGSRALSSVVFALVVSGVVLLVLLAARRIGRRTYVPFGPFFIVGALWAVLLRSWPGRPSGPRTRPGEPWLPGLDSARIMPSSRCRQESCPLRTAIHRRASPFDAPGSFGIRGRPSELARTMTSPWSSAARQIVRPVRP